MSKPDSIETRSYDFAVMMSRNHQYESEGNILVILGVCQGADFKLGQKSLFICIKSKKPQYYDMISLKIHIVLLGEVEYVFSSTSNCILALDNAGMSTLRLKFCC